jgi:hypothetical protein
MKHNLTGQNSSRRVGRLKPMVVVRARGGSAGHQGQGQVVGEAGRGEVQLALGLTP